MLSGFLSVFLPAIIIILVLFVVFMFVFRKRLRAMRDKEDSVYHRLFGNDNKKDKK